MAFDTAWDENIYSKGFALNQYPYGELISIFFYALKYLKTEKPKDLIKVLEVGCGSGNNLWFIRELGFDVTGIDGSEIAIESARALFEKRNLNATLLQGVFGSLPFEDETFDIVIDRGGTICQTRAEIKQAWQEAGRVLAPSGLFISFLLNTSHPTAVQLALQPQLATKVESNCYTNIHIGPLKDVGTISFITLDALTEIFDFGTILSIHEHSLKSVFESDEVSAPCYCEYIVVGRKQ